MSISLITNFRINSNQPIDTRLVATGADGLNNMEYKYEGLTVYRTDTGYNYVWDGDSWNLASNGIYGGSGSLISDTVIDQGFVGVSTGDKTNSLTLGASSSLELFNFSSNFIRNTTGDVEFKQSLLFGTSSGPYISFNPTTDLFLKRGGISLGTGDDINFPSSERIRIDNNGLIRLRPLNTLTASLDVFYSGEDITFGYNWHGSKENNSIGSSYIQFSNQKVTINHASTNSVVTSRSITFNHPDHNYVVEINGNLNTSKNIYLGDGLSFYHVSYDGVGLGIDSQNNEVSLFNNGLVKGVLLNNFSLTLGSTDYNVIIPTGTTFTTLGKFNASYETNIWDNAFNVDRNSTEDVGILDNYWSRNPDPNDSFNDNGTSNTVNVSPLSATFSQDTKFVFSPITYIAKNTISTWVNTKKSYDRMFYFFNDKSDYHISHEIDWYLSNDDQVSWKKIGHLETGNQNNFNQESGATASYANRHYSQSVLVPAEMDFKIKFSFPYDYTPDVTPAIDSLPNFVITSIRSGKWRTPNSTTPISNL